MTAAQRRETGAMLSGPRAGDRHAAREVGEAYMKSASWMRTLRRRAARGEEPRPPGRPPLGEAERARVRGLVEEQRRVQGGSAGSPAILEALRRQGTQVSRMLVEQELAALKRAGRVLAQAAMEARRVGHEMRARDAVWGEDTTHVGRCEDGAKVEAEVVKDLATLETAGLAVGAVPSAQDVIHLLERLAGERGGWPLALQVDHGSIYRAQGVIERLERERVVLVLSRVHTPTDNAATEHQHGELKRESGLGKGSIVASQAEAHERLCAARRTLDQGRRRATRGWRTAAEVAADLPRADAVVDRGAFHAAARSAMEQAVHGLTHAREACAAARAAFFQTLCAFGLATRHVGRRPRRRPGPPPCSAPGDRVECPRAVA